MTHPFAILPFGAILFIGTTFFGTGTLEDLPLVLFTGVIAGTCPPIRGRPSPLLRSGEREPVRRRIREDADPGGHRRARAKPPKQVKAIKAKAARRRRRGE